MTRRLKKVGYDGEKVTVRWEVVKLGGTDEHELISNDSPAPEFVQALKDLVPAVLEICQMPDDYGATTQ